MKKFLIAFLICIFSFPLYADSPNEINDSNTCSVNSSDANCDVLNLNYENNAIFDRCWRLSYRECRRSYNCYWDYRRDRCRSEYRYDRRGCYGIRSPWMCRANPRCEWRHGYCDNRRWRGYETESSND
ncbi:MAG: hypothetical protein HQK53_07445 [Oligoflexia bacterium]|nr:hypothetical protein [Oligoflexia bacterium]